MWRVMRDHGCLAVNGLRQSRILPVAMIDIYLRSLGRCEFLVTGTSDPDQMIFVHVGRGMPNIVDAVSIDSQVRSQRAAQKALSPTDQFRFLDKRGTMIGSNFAQLVLAIDGTILVASIAGNDEDLRAGKAFRDPR
jgi:hypothetical protein